MWEKLREKQQITDQINFSTPRTRFLVTPGIEVHNTFANDDVVWISWKYSTEELVPTLRHTYEVIGAYITAGAKFHLCSYLDRLKKKAIYTDTDSVIYVQPRNKPSLIETGENLG
jgi:hypothetical protein